MSSEEERERRYEALRRLGAKLVWLTCMSCRVEFLDWERLGGQVWRIKKVVSGDYRYPGIHGRYCSQGCAESALLKVNADAAWVEGFEP